MDRRFREALLKLLPPATVATIAAEDPSERLAARVARLNRTVAARPQAALGVLAYWLNDARE